MQKTRDQIAKIHGFIEKARELQKTNKQTKNTICFIDYTKAFDCVDHNKLENSRDGNSRPSYMLPEKSICRSRSNS